MSPKVHDRLSQILGPDNYCRQKEDRVSYAYDATRNEHVPEAVAFPQNPGQVAEILSLATARGFAVTPRGAGSGMSGGAIAARQGLVLVMTGFNRIVRIDADNFIGIVQPGVVTGEFQRAVAGHGLFYPPDPSSADFSTLGGNLAECAGGPRAVKYGVTRDYVLGLEVVLPTGEIIKTGVQTVKGVVGYDLTRLIVGSEGTLGVITEMTLRLRAQPQTVETLSAWFVKMADAARAVAAILQSGIVPRALEYMDKNAISCVKNYLEGGVPENREAMLLIEADGSPGQTAEAVQGIEKVLAEHGARDVCVARDADAAAGLWRARKAISPALYTYGPHKINEDIVVPRSRLPEMVEKIRELGEKTGLTMVSFGHAGDGNIHFNIMLDKNEPAQLLAARQAVDEIFDFTLALGGTISGEHGVGLAKAPYMQKEISDAALGLMKRIKAAFDPAGILNPGKMRL
ncbi:MAG: FAD-binding protein [Desulfobacterales bacterium]|nr:FAD-binding protein [Desulfobacterales bacterium]